MLEVLSGRFRKQHGKWLTRVSEPGRAWDIGHNRLRVNADGSVSWFERNLTRVPTSPVDPTVTVMRIDRADGSPIAVLTNYACHPVVFGSDNLRYSADFPGVMNRVVEEKFGGRTQSFFLQGAPGDINPYFAVTPIEEDAVKERDWTGERLGREVARVASGIHTQGIAQPSIEFAEESLPVHLRWDVEEIPRRAAEVPGPQGMDTLRRAHQSAVQVSATTVLINKEIALMTVPVSRSLISSMNWRDRCPVPTALLLGYTNGYNGYFPTIAVVHQAATQRPAPRPGSSRVPESVSVDRAVVNVYEMLGR